MDPSVQALHEGSEEAFYIPCLQLSHTTQQQAQRGEGDCLELHSKIGPNKPSKCLEGYHRQVGGKRDPSLLLWFLENVPSHSSVGAELKATAEGWESYLL